MVSRRWLGARPERVGSLREPSPRPSGLDEPRIARPYASCLLATKRRAVSAPRRATSSYDDRDEPREGRPECSATQIRAGLARPAHDPIAPRPVAGWAQSAR